MKLLPTKRRHGKKTSALLKVLFPVVIGALGKKSIPILHRAGVRMLVAQRTKKKIFGVMAISSFFVLTRKVMFLHAFVVASGARGQGIGQRMLDLLEQRALAKRHDYLCFVSAPGKRAAHKLYLRNGYTRILWLFFYKKLTHKKSEHLD